MDGPTESSRLCIFCDQKADSREHAIPKWVAKRLNLRGVRLHHGEPSTIPTTRKQSISFASHRERIFCKACNTHFKALEDEAIPLIEWMAKGRAITLGPDDRRLLARWGAKTGFALMAAEKEFRDFVPREHMAWLRERDEPHALNWVGWASWDGHVFKSNNDQSVTSSIHARPFRAYTEVLAFAGVAFKLFGLFEPIPGVRIYGDWPGLRQVWPILGKPISWPLTRAPNTRAATDTDWTELISILPLTTK